METTPPTLETIAEKIAETVETIAETIATVPLETMATVPPETVPAVTEVIEVAESIDYTPLLSEMLTSLQNNEMLLGYIYSFLLFFVVVALCYFCYKFFRIFF